MTAHDDLLDRCAANCGGSYAAIAEAMGRPTARWNDVWAADLGLPVALSPNSATLLRPLESRALEDALDRVHSFFASSPGGGYEVRSIWPTRDLSTTGYERSEAPAMVLPSGFQPNPSPPELRIVEVDGAAGVRDAEALWIESFGVEGATPGSMGDERILNAWRVWVGYLDGTPMSTAAAFTSDGLLGIYAVATTPAARGRGFGEALTWAAATSDPSLPVSLQASELGMPVYERMGFRTVGGFTVWTRER